MPKKEQQKLERVAECLYRNTSSGTYYGLVRKDRQQIKRSLKTQDRKLAERKLREFREEVGQLSSNIDARRIKFDALADRWLKTANTGKKKTTADRNTGLVKKLTQSHEFKGQQASSISRRDCEDWAANRSQGIQPRTYNYELRTLKRIFEYAIEIGAFLKNPAHSLKTLKDAPKEIIVPTRKQFDRLISTLEKMTQKDARSRYAIELVKLLAYSGMRLNEAVSITWEEIDFDRELFTVSGGEKGTKNGEIRNVPIFPRFRAFLEEIRAQRAEIGGESINSGQVSQTKTARTAIESACKTAKLPKFDHHCLRHYFVSNAIENGVDFKTIAQWIGHKDGGLLVAKTYGHLRDTHSFEMAKLMT